MASKEKVSRKQSQLDKDKINREINDLLAENCCEKDCCKSISIFDVIRLRESFWNKIEEAQNQFILDFLDSQKYIHKTSYTFDGNSICQKAWLFCYGISKSRFYRKKSSYEDGQRDGETDRKRPRDCSEKTMIAKNWLKDFADDCGDAPPDRNKLDRILPACYTQKAVYDTYKEWAEEKGISIISAECFRLSWKNDFPHVTISQNNRFSKCGLCTLIKDIRQSTRDDRFKQEMQEVRKLHNEQQMGERAKYKKHQMKARSNPTKYLSIIVDGMDQNKTSLPHFTTLSKAYSSEFVKTHISGVISHGHNKNFYVIDLHEAPHDSNLTMTILGYVLLRVSKNGILPPVLYLQLDNCWRENKNQFLLGLCSYLVMKGIFRKIRLSYLLVGHTHEDIDSTFSNISTTLKKNDVLTVDGLLKTVKNSFIDEKKTSVCRLEYVFNYRDWLKDNIRTPTHHTEPHAYKFEKENNDTVAISYKRFSMDKEWTTLSPTILSHMPEGTPALVRFDWRKQCAPGEMREKLTSCETKFSRTEIDWWNNFLEDLQSRQKFWSSSSEEKLQELADSGFYIKDLKPYNETLEINQMTEDDIRRRDCVKSMIVKGQKKPRTAIGKLSARERKELEK